MMNNLGPLGDLLITLVIFSLLIQLLRCFFGCCPIFKHVYDFLDKLLFFNSFIQATNQGFFFFFFVTLLSFSDMSDKTPDADKGMTYFMIVYLVLYPILTFIFLIRAKSRIHMDLQFKDRLGSLFELVHTHRGLPPLLNVIVFFIRRVFLAYILIFWRDSALSQIFGLMASSFMILVYQCHYQPFVNKVDQFFEFFNEASLLGVSYCLLATLITEHKYEEQGERFQGLDYSLLFVILMVIVLNFINYLVTCLRDISKILRRLSLNLQRLWSNLNHPQKCSCNLQCHNQHDINRTVAIAPSFEDASNQSILFSRQVLPLPTTTFTSPQLLLFNPSDNKNFLINHPTHHPSTTQSLVQPDQPPFIVFSQLDDLLHLHAQLKQQKRQEEIEEEKVYYANSYTPFRDVHHHQQAIDQKDNLAVIKETTWEDEQELVQKQPRRMNVFDREEEEKVRETQEEVEVVRKVEEKVEEGKDNGMEMKEKSLIKDWKEKLQLIKQAIHKKNKQMGKKKDGDSQWQ